MSEVVYHLRDIKGSLVEAWSRWFSDIPEVKPDRGDIFAVKADAIISPANSFGFMDGGIDLLYTTRFGWQLQERLQRLLRMEWDGELPVGMAVLVETGDPALPWLISAPTMRIPQDVSDTVNAYLAFRAALRVVQQHNAQSPGSIRSVLCPGLGTATGRMSAEICAKQMHAAYTQIIGGKPWQPKDVNAIINEHHRLLREED